MSATDELFYRRLLFRTKLLGDRRYTPSHFWVQQQESGLWRIGLTKFASRMLGDVVEIGFDVNDGDRLELGDSIGWFEGFKARTDLYSVASGIFAGSNPLLVDRIVVIDDDRYGRGWLYEVQGEPDPAAMDMHGYAALLDDTIDRMRHSQKEPAE
ncbi:MAG TPA: glycine cleavage system protein H [Vicinamibacterales bacterium]|nr:glycine cleavage system protein H [Vicinamibacterales bacterium]